jgi:hypothetical protein
MSPTSQSQPCHNAARRIVATISGAQALALPTLLRYAEPTGRSREPPPFSGLQ